MSDDRTNPLARLWRACLLILGSVICLWVAVHLIREIWIPLVIALLVAGLILWLMARRNRW